MKNCQSPVSAGVTLVLIALLNGCGGGSGGSGSEQVSAPLAPAATLSFEATKIFRFNWTDVDSATSYKLLENPDGASGFSQIGNDIAVGAETFALEVPLYARTNAQYILQACNSGGCTDSDTLAVSDGINDAIGFIKASNTEAGDFFGIYLAISGDGETLAVAADSEDSAATGVNGEESDNSAENSGAVYIFTHTDSGQWTQQAYLKASNSGAEDYFGFPVVLSYDGSTLAVGTSNEDSAASGINGDQTDNSAANSGAVYVFSRDGDDEWSQQAYIKASNTGAGDHFGYAISLSSDGSVMSIGAPYESSSATGINGEQNDDTAEYSGAVYLFSRDSTDSWSQQTYFKASNTDANADYFGYAVALTADGTGLAVGAPGEYSSSTGINGDQEDNSAGNSGAAYVFTQDDSGDWSQQAYIKASNTGSGDWFGNAVAFNADGTTLAVGANSEDSAAIGIDGDQSDNTAPNTGAVYVFTQDANSDWSQQAYIKASHTGNEDYFGDTIELSADGNTLAINAYAEDGAASGINGSETDLSADQSGATYVFTRSDGQWSQLAYLKAKSSDAGDWFGRPALSDDASVLVIEAPADDSASSGVNGDPSDNSATNSGAVYLY